MNLHYCIIPVILLSNSIYFVLFFITIHSKLFIFIHQACVYGTNPSAPIQSDPAAEKGGSVTTADLSQPAHPSEGPAPMLPTSPSDTFLTTPDEDEEDDHRHHQMASAAAGPEEEGIKHRTHKKDLLEIDRFTICGNRID